MPVQATLKAATFEMCIYDEDEYQSYVNAFEKLAIGMPKRRTDVVEITDVVANDADIPKDAPALSPNDVAYSYKTNSGFECSEPKLCQIDYTHMLLNQILGLIGYS